MTRKVKVTFSGKQKLEYAKLMVEGGYSNIQVEKISGAGKSAVSRWKQQYLAELNGNTPVKSKALTPEQQRIQELEVQLKRAQRDNDILKSRGLLHPRQSKLKIVKQLKIMYPNFTVTELCPSFEVSSSSFYYETKIPTVENERLCGEIKRIFYTSGQIYGKRRIQVELKGLGHQIGTYKISNIMKLNQLVAIRPTKKHYYHSSGNEHRYAPNLLKRQFSPEQHNHYYVGDITYIRHHYGWSYLACVLDLATKEIIGYALSTKPDSKLVKEALDNAIERQLPDTTSLMFHSDQGCQYSSEEFRAHLFERKITQSMSRRGNCLDNAVMERFFRSLKTERLNRLSFMNHQSVVCEVENYIQFYNYYRRHSTIGYLTPHQKYHELKNAA
ncbi:IS3 family transposase [Arsenophonus nasoniae]|uniref:IS3 family transposase n=1 Tax=Arsenophonus nasoniae TaxID=638 RepID=A0ABY8NV96_9GAMM|nr:IS3 family transposase [Arsenophonus nasoniae]WGM08335.1 IS3 family transposase [Arsenophonus nasoniae]WGM10615.1 IS3 family transposase [Arsenophonus nasoniae]